MLQSAALIVVIAAGLWLGGVGVLMALRPRTCLELMGRMTVSLEASDWRLNLIEQGLRIVAGAALVVRSPASKLPPAFEVAGSLLVITSLVILALPVRWHGAYGRMLLGRLTLPALRLLSPLPILAAAGLIWAAI